MALADVNGSDWIYKTGSENASPGSSRVIVGVSDLPGNVVVKEMVV